MSTTELTGLREIIEPTVFSRSTLYQASSTDFSEGNMAFIQTETNPLALLAQLKSSSSLDSTAIDTTMNAVFLHSRGLANALDVAVEDFSEISRLLEQLKNRQLITEKEWNRLTVIQMALDGLDIEVNEYEAELTPEDIDYAFEFCQIVNKAYSRLDVNQHPITQTWSMLGRRYRTMSSAINPIGSFGPFTSSANRTVNLSPGDTITVTWQLLASG